MTQFPKPQSKVTDAIFRAWEERSESWDSLGFSPSAIATECDRALFLQIHWAAAAEVFDGRKLRLFQTGHIEEARMVEELRWAGYEVYDVDPNTGKQFSVRALAGHVRGKTDGRILGVDEAPSTWHVLECKSHNDASFKALIKAGPGNLRKGKYEHWVQCQLYMHLESLDRCLYSAVNKNNDDRWNDRVYYDHEFCTHLMARLERILAMDAPPAPVSTNDKSPTCIFCKAKPICRGRSFARLNCRTCLHSAPDMSGNAAWSCARWAKPLTPDEQRAACPAHLYVPDLVPGEMGEVDEAAETISYTLHDGRTWVDGRDQAEAPVEIETQGDSE